MIPAALLATLLFKSGVEVLRHVLFSAATSSLFSQRPSFLKNNFVVFLLPVLPLTPSLQAEQGTNFSCRRS